MLKVRASFASRLAAVAVIPFISIGMVSAEIFLIDVEASPTEWARATRNLQIHDAWDLSALPDFGVTSTAGPLTSLGGGPIPAGFIPSNVQIDASRFFPDQPISLAFIGPSANGYDNAFNAIVPNQPQDSLNILFSEAVDAFEFDAVSCSNCSGATGLIDIVVTDNRGAQTAFANVPAPAAGHIWGLVGTNGRRIRLVNLNGQGVEPGSLDQDQQFPGIQGASFVYGRGKGQ